MVEPAKHNPKTRMNKTANALMSFLREAVSPSPPQNMANERPMDGEAGATARAINASTPGDPSSPMDNTRIIRRPPANVLSNVSITPAQCVIFSQRLAEGVWYTGVPQSLRDAIAPKKARWDNVQNAILQNIPSPVRAYNRHQQETAERIAAGDPCDERDSWTVQDFAQDQEEKIRALKEKAREIEAEAWSLIEPELHRKAAAIDEMADHYESQERDRAESWGYSCVGPWILGLRKFAQELRNGSRRGIGNPAGMLDGI